MQPSSQPAGHDPDIPDTWTTPLTDLLALWDRLDRQGQDHQAVRALCKLDRFYLLVKVCRRYDLWHPWLYARCREVERDPDGYLDLWARGHYKSTIITYGGVIQEILRDPNITVGLFSHVKPIAKAFLAQIKREFEHNELMKACFPDVLYASPERESPSWSLDAGLIVRRSQNPKEATLEAHGLVDGQPTAKHFRLLVYDDVVTRESVSTPEQVQKTTEAWELSDNLGTLTCRKWHIGTRYSFGDTWQSIMDRGSVKPRIYPATHNGQMDGDPVLLTPDEWEAKKIEQGEAVVACQQLQNPIAGQQRMFDVNDLQTYEVRPETLNVYITIDPGRSRKKGSAHTAMVVQGFDYAGNKYLLDGWDHKMDLMERWVRMRDLYVKWVQAPGVQYVAVGYERYGAIADLDYFQEQQKLERVSFEIVELEWPSDGDGSKIDRVQRMGPDIRSHKLFLPYDRERMLAAAYQKIVEGGNDVPPFVDWKRGMDELTRLQRATVESGYAFRVAKPIRRKDGEGNIYDLAERFRSQLSFFPFGGLKDIVDAASRIYDMQARAPILYESSGLEPEFV